ncbi:maltose acetyltransferase [Enterovibrio norvegicus]|uniref:Maltose O-acetyltransferase n=2 Tax=Enterovibrio norvegicus TaxID=188144 RepID=A0A1I5VWU6_9GAMM|nr:maltose acetyltransferase domain-containing protein [Enterovibrio norvegicus]MCC4797153.1 sugar O-acetyltransferase [Enterovibrio norvegicus]OEE60760.1 maltose acetyltransferase [Enterovibrio norvegicus]OEF58211.1 maltose acetyltransferase [Enterovibrio norvegicus]OEF62827.1 maltose acetyltransferase [Enterovibrio norvegicus]PMH63993.1 maltose acetyltransferase [Enterovibrio norvegicus]
MTEFEKMQQGNPYSPADVELTQFRFASRRLCQTFNALDPAATEQQDMVVTKLFARRGKEVAIEAPFTCSYGMNIHLGSNVAIGPNCTIIDSGHVEIGNNVHIGPSVGIYANSQCLLPLDILHGEQEISLPIIIGNNVVIGGSSAIKAGVCIGEGAVVDIGAVVEDDVEPFAVVAGNPAVVVRRLR